MIFSSVCYEQLLLPTQKQKRFEHPKAFLHPTQAQSEYLVIFARQIDDFNHDVFALFINEQVYVGGIYVYRIIRKKADAI